MESIKTPQKMAGLLSMIIQLSSGFLGGKFIGIFYPKYSFGAIGNPIVGIFGAILGNKFGKRMHLGLLSNEPPFPVSLPLVLQSIIITLVSGFLFVALMGLIKNKIEGPTTRLY